MILRFVAGYEIPVRGVAVLADIGTTARAEMSCVCRSPTREADGLGEDLKFRGPTGVAAREVGAYVAAGEALSYHPPRSRIAFACSAMRALIRP